MDLTEVNVGDVVTLFHRMSMSETQLCLHEKAPLGLCLVNPKYVIVSEKLSPPHGSEFLEAGKWIDARVLGAKDFSYGKFRPPGESEYQDIRCYSYVSGILGGAGRAINSLLEAVNLALVATSHERLDISEMFESGNYHLEGNNQIKLDIRALSRGVTNTKAGRLVGETALVFRAGEDCGQDSTEKVFTMELNLLRAFKDLGFKITGHIIEGSTKPLVVMKSDLLRAVGIVRDFPLSGIRTSPDGRRISKDALEVSWIPEVFALDAIESETGHFRPVSNSLAASRYISSEDDVEKIVRDTYSNLGLAVSALRWHGYPEHQILKILKTRQYEAWFDIHSDILTRAKEKLEQAFHGAASVPYLENQTRQLCGEFERLQKVMKEKGNPEQLDFGILRNLAEKVAEMKERKNEV